MQARQRGCVWLGLSAGVLLLFGGSVRGQTAGEVMPLAVANGRCRCVLPTDQPGEKYYLILGALARKAGHYRVTVHTEPTESPPSLAVEKAVTDEAWGRAVQTLGRRLETVWKRSPPADAVRLLKEPPENRTFYLFTRERDFENAAGYQAIQADLRAVGRHCQVYLDSDHADPAAVQPTVNDIVRTFDGEIYPRAGLRLGQALDVDRDGRFTILLTGRLNRLCDGKVSLSGFVRGSDFFRDLEAPYGNRCDMMYLNSDLKAGPYLRTILAHEYTHAVVFSEHVFGPYLPEVPRQDEESWLNEGLAHLNEDLHGYSWSNLGHRMRAFLDAPERYQLVVPDYYGAGLWRSHGNRGAIYLFLRWCADQHGDDLLRRLTQTNLSGVANLEVATRQRFPDLFRDWSANLLLSGTNLGTGRLQPLRRDLHRVLDGQLLCGPRFAEVTLAGDCREVSVTGTAVAYVLLHSSAGPRSCVTITSDPAADLQVSLVRLPQDTSRLSLCWQPADAARTGRLVLTAHDADLTLDGGDIEPVVPRESLREDEKRGSAAPERIIQEWFGTAAVRRGETRRSQLIALPETDGEFVFKVAATDDAGHRIAGWALVPPATHKTGFLKKPGF